MSLRVGLKARKLCKGLKKGNKTTLVSLTHHLRKIILKRN